MEAEQAAGPLDGLDRTPAAGKHKLELGRVEGQAARAAKPGSRPYVQASTGVSCHTGTLVSL